MSAAEARATMAALGERPYHPAEAKGLSYEDCQKLVRRSGYSGDDDLVLVIRKSVWRRHCGQRMWILKVYSEGCKCGHGRYAHTAIAACACMKCNTRKVLW